jgi:tetratricopeptide (TPR) repeat protein
VPIEELTGDGSQYRLLTFRKKKEKSDTSFIMLLINFRPAQAAGTAADLRDSHIENLTKSKSLAGGKPKTSEYNGVPVASYKVSSGFLNHYFNLSPIALIQAGQRTLQAYFVRDGVWVTIVFSASDIGEAEERLFYSLLDSARFVDTSAPSTSFDYYHLGRVLYLTEDYHKAAEPLTMAVGLEHRERRLDTASWRDLVAKLIDSLSRSGEVKKSKELMDYAVARDPSYPLFDMALARYHAYYGDLDKTIRHLEKAFLNRQNAMFAPLPDPLDDPAFERFRKDERFKKAVKEMKKKPKD